MLVKSLSDRLRLPVAYIGIDPGVVGGALALLSVNDQLLAVESMPIIRSKRKEIDITGVRDLVSSWNDQYQLRAVVEKVTPAAAGSLMTAFYFSSGFYVPQAILSCFNVPYRLVSPATWKKEFSAIQSKGDAAKEDARAECCRRWPYMADRFRAKNTHNKAEASLIAAYCRMLMQNG